MNTNRDSVIVLGEKGEEIFSFDLDTIYPHKLNLAISNTGETLVSTPSGIEFYGVSGKKILNLKRNYNNGVYQAVYHNGNWFAVELNQEILFIDEVGKILKKEKIRGSDFPLRFFPSGKNTSVVLETKKELFLYRNL